MLRILRHQMRPEPAAKIAFERVFVNASVWQNKCNFTPSLFCEFATVYLHVKCVLSLFHERTLIVKVF